MRWIRLYIQMLRPRVASMLLLFGALGAVSTGYTPTVTALALLHVLAIASWYVNATTANDISDVEIDKINLKKAKGRPLAHSTASLKDIWKLNVFSGGVAVGIAAIAGWQAAAIMFVGILLNYAYSLPPLRLSYKGYIAPLLLPLGYVVIPYTTTLYAFGGSPTADSLQLLLAIYVAFVGRIILKDIRDIKGDAKFGKNTFAVMHGKKATYTVSAVFWVSGYLLLASQFMQQPVVGACLFVLLCCILACLARLYKTNNYEQEQLFIGLAATAANGVVVTLLSIRLLTLANYTTSDLRVACVALAFLYAYVVIGGLRHPEGLRNTYRG